MFVCGGCTGNLKEEQDEILLETVAESSENLEHADDAEQSEAGETLPETAEPQETAETRLGSTIYVHVCGHVKYPGVYQMQEGSRVYEAIDKAGGMLEEGAGDAMNMAAVLEDGMRIMVPDLAQAAQMIEQGAVFDPGSSASVSDRKGKFKQGRCERTDDINWDRPVTGRGDHTLQGRNWQL